MVPGRKGPAGCIYGKSCRVKDAGGGNDLPRLLFLTKRGIYGDTLKFKDNSNFNNYYEQYFEDFELARNLLIRYRECGARKVTEIEAAEIADLITGRSEGMPPRLAVKLPECDR